MSLYVLSVGPAVALQDLGRPGFMAQGLTQGGAADRLALCEGAALLGQGAECAALEMVGLGGRFRAEADMTIALTGAEMRTLIDGVPAVWNASHTLMSGQVLEIGPVLRGVYGYLHVPGGFAVAKVLGARGAHISAGIGDLVREGAHLPIAAPGLRDELILQPKPRLSGGALRIMPSMQTELFEQSLRDQLSAGSFTRDARSDRQGMRLVPQGPPLQVSAGLSVVSEVAVPGDVQIAGSGDPFILLAEGQTTAGYPRIGTLLPSDLPRAVQCPAGMQVRFEWISFADARRLEAQARTDRDALPQGTSPRIRAPEDIANLGDYNLISGAITGD